MASYKVELLPAADKDLDQIFDYILLDNPEAAENVLEQIFKTLKHLKQFPYVGVKLVERSLLHYEFQMVVSEPYIAFYRVIEGSVLIYRILHGARVYIQILKNNN